MLLRWLVNQYLRDAAEDKVRAVLGETLGQLAPRKKPASNPSQPAAEEAAPEQIATEGDEFLPCDIAFLYALNIEAGGLLDQVKGAETSRHKHGVEHAGASASGRSSSSSRASAAGGGAGHEGGDRVLPAAVGRLGRLRGSLDENLRRGHILMANEVADLAGEQLAVGLSLDADTVAATRGLHVGRLLTVDDIIRQPQERRELGEQHAAVACDMETYAVAQTCRELDVRFLSVRIISDAVDDELPPKSSTSWRRNPGPARSARPPARCSIASAPPKTCGNSAKTPSKPPTAWRSSSAAWSSNWINRNNRCARLISRRLTASGIHRGSLGNGAAEEVLEHR